MGDVVPGVGWDFLRSAQTVSPNATFFLLSPLLQLFRLLEVSPAPAFSMSLMSIAAVAILLQYL